MAPLASVLLLLLALLGSCYGSGAVCAPLTGPEVVRATEIVVTPSVVHPGDTITIHVTLRVTAEHPLTDEHASFTSENYLGVIRTREQKMSLSEFATRVGIPYPIETGTHAFSYTIETPHNAKTLAYDTRMRFLATDKSVIGCAVVHYALV